MTVRRWAASFRTRILTVVLAVTVLPLVLVGLWLNAAAARAGEEFVTERVQAAVRDAAVVAGTRWLALRSDMLDVAEEEAFRQALSSEAALPGESIRAEPPIEVTSVLRRAALPLGRTLVRDSLGRVVWEIPNEASGSSWVGATVQVDVDVYTSAMGRRLGSLRSEIAVSTLVPDNTPAPGGVGTLLGVYEPEGGAPLVPLPFGLEVANGEEVEWGGDRWRLDRRIMVDPPLMLVAAAPLSPFTAPYLGAARRGALVLGLVGVLGFLAALVLTNRVASSLERLASATEAVSAGDLERTVDIDGDDELGRVGRAFNQMTENLKSTLQELADSRALAAVGEFAAQMAHEIRNPLSAVRIDLQLVEEGLPEGSRLREIQERVLSEIERLDVTLSGALRTAQSGRTARGVVDVREPFCAATTSARTTAALHGVDVSTDVGDRPAEVTGDAAALEQVFLNLLLNAVEASPAGTRVHASLASDEVGVVIEIADVGDGIPPEEMRRVYEPLYTTRRDGSGLGLTIARRLVLAHGGRIEIESEVGEGTVARVRLPTRM